jgi:hypothetical protein
MNLDSIFNQAKQALIALYGEKLVSLAVFGSAAVGEFLAKVSDINLLVVLTNVGLPEMDAIRKFMRQMQGQPLGTPLLMTKDFIRSSADVFPIEFLEIKEKHQLLFGEDCFSKLKISSQNLRHECEHEIKGRYLRMSQSYLEISEKAEALRQLLLSGHNANFPAFRSLLRLKKIKPPIRREEVLQELVKTFGLNPESLQQADRLRESKLKLDGPGLRELFKEYINEMEKLAKAVDKL